MLFASGCSVQPAEQPTEQPAEQQAARSAEQERTDPTCRIVVAPEVGASILSFAEESYDVCFSAWLESYAASRKVEVVFEGRDALSFGPWEAAEDRLTTDAAADGSLTEWNDHYYITHDWSQIGECILAFVPGDVVTVNGRSVTIQGIFNYPKDGYYDEVVSLTGKDAVVFQTCYPNSDDNRIAYGS